MQYGLIIMVSPNWIGRFCADGKDLGPIVVEKVVDFVAATTGAVASKELFTVTGLVNCTVIGVCETTDVTGAGSIEVGIAGDTDIFIGTTVGTAIDAGEMMLHTTPPTFIKVSDTVPQWIWSNGIDLGYEISAATLTAGRVRFYCLYYPLSTGARVESAGVNVTL